MLHPFSTFEQDPFFNFDKKFSSAFDDIERQFDISRHFSERLSLDDRPTNNRSLALARHKDKDSRSLARHDRSNMLSPFSGMDLFDDMNQMMKNMHRNMEMLERSKNDPNCFTFQSSSFYSYEKNGKEGEPHTYEAHHAVKRAGDMKEEQKGMRDSRLGEERMHMGRYIGDRGEVQERRRNLRTGDREDNKELIGLETDEDAARFEETWRDRARRFNSVDRDTRHQNQLQDRSVRNKDNSNSKALKPIRYKDTGRARK